VNFGAVLVKFWLHIDAAEQLRRFRARERSAYKRWKITDEDWRNRAKRKAYAAAVDEMAKLAAAQGRTAAQMAAAELQQHGVIPDLTLESEGCGDIIALFREHGITGESILLPGSNLHDEFLVGGLQSLGNRVTPLCVYKHGAQELEQSIDFAFIDEIFFASPSCVRNFGTMFGAIPERITVTCADQRTEEEYRMVFG